jgi:hypothetical protein
MLYAAVILALAIPSLGLTQTVSTPIVGFSKVEAPAGGRIVAPVFVKAPVFSGSSVISGQSFSGSFSSALNPTSFTDRPNYPTHYVEIVSGANEGMSFDVESASGSSLTVSGIPSSLNGATVSIVIRPHINLADLATSSVGLQDHRDAITIFRENNQKSSYIYTSTGVVADDYATPADNVVIYPGTGVVLNNGASASFTSSGQVKTTKTIVPIYSGESIVAPVDPQGGKTVSQLNIAGALVPYSDSFSLVSTSGNLAANSFYSDGTDVLDENYSPVSGSTDLGLSFGNGLIINANTDSNCASNSPLGNWQKKI